ncbi:bacteriophage abortive infection AbiH family protein [Chryseobacterium sp. MEBOG06]|uniref:hypothetical protein n=1 Tax=Chryseobacterium sp. MEBOG06 TaxID=2879938 RepID=UPI00397C4FD0|nr:bacteriophage abortive infection AbiH family protein [Chryseobacterium sp. MEBOG06]
MGNGFDLAHGMPTSYGNFIDDYWQNAIEKIRNKPHWEDGFENDEFYIQPLPEIWEGNNDYEALQYNLSNISNNINFKNDFFAALNKLEYNEKNTFYYNNYTVESNKCPDSIFGIYGAM